MNPQNWEPSILGWSEDILPFYERMAEALPVSCAVAEIGVYRGRSFLYLVASLDEKGKVPFAYAIDCWDQSDEASHRPGNDELEAFVSASMRLRLGRHIHVKPKRSEQAAEEFTDASLDLVFIDAAHTYAGVRADIALWLPKVKPGGVLAGHDYSASFPGVGQAVREAFGDVRVTGTVWEVVKP
jgi:Methyltransferase domain